MEMKKSFIYKLPLLVCFLLILYIGVTLGSVQKSIDVKIGTLVIGLHEGQIEDLNEDPDNIIQVIIFDILFFIGILGISLAYLIPLPTIIWDIIFGISGIIILIVYVRNIIRLFKEKKKK